MDFDDLELLTRELLVEREGVRAAWSDRFELLMVDEFQDTNPRQLGILTALDRGNLFTVGDELQSIYGFRHADVSLFRARRAELDERGGSLRADAKLPQPCAAAGGRQRGVRRALRRVHPAGGRPGRRPAPSATSGALTAAGAVATEVGPSTLTGGGAAADEHPRLGAAGGARAAIAAELPHAQLWRQAEARLLAQRVAELVREGTGAGGGGGRCCCVPSGDLEVFERALQLRGLRTLAAVGAFWGHQQIGDLIAYLRALANPLDEQALYAALASPLVGCSRDGLALLADAARAARGACGRRRSTPAWRGRSCGASSRRPTVRRSRRFCARLQSERETAARRTISELIERAIATSGYREHVLGLDWGERRLANVHKLLRLARRFEAGEGRDLRAFLDHVEYLREAVKVEPDAPVAGVESDAVRLMTIHAAKGLEFPVVCVADLGRQPNTQTPDLLVEGDRVGLRLVRLDGAASSPALDYQELCQERRERELEEEDRIMYVAMTRARERLLLSGAIDFERWSGSRQAPTAISWLGPALAANLSALLEAEDTFAHELPIGPEGAVSVRCRLNTATSVGAVLRLDSLGEKAAGADTPVPAEPGPVGREPVEGEQLSLSVGGAPSSTPSASLESLSYTSLSELERCGYRYYLERVLGLPEDRSLARADGGHRGLEARARGTLIHGLMESLDFLRPSAPSSEQVARRARELGMRVTGEECEEIASLIEVASTAELAVRVAGARAVRREHPFAFSLAGEQPLISGFIDLLAEERDGGSLVLDYKSDRVDRASDLGALVEREYGIQRLLYALAALREGAAQVEVVHWFLERPHEWVSACYTAAERPALEQRLAAHVERARARGFAVSDTPHRVLCLTCPGRAGLCSWNESETMREEPALDPPAPGR